MAAKRARDAGGGSVTGGTGDVKPQILTLTVDRPAGPDLYAVNQIALPVPRFGTVKDRATVVEILSLDWYINILNQGDANSTDWGFLSTNSARTLTTTSNAASQRADVEDPLTFGMVSYITGLNTNGLLVKSWPLHYDLTDNNGNGMIVATDRIFIVIGNVASGLATTGTCKMKYRLVNVGITEYVGIVQSQQA